MVTAKLSPSPNSCLLTPKNPRATYFILKFAVHLRPLLCHSASLSAFLLLLCSFHPVFAGWTCSAGWLQRVRPSAITTSLQILVNGSLIAKHLKNLHGEKQDDAGSLSILFTCPSPLFYQIAPWFDNTHISFQKHLNLDFLSTLCCSTVTGVTHMSLLGCCSRILQCYVVRDI